MPELTDTAPPSDTEREERTKAIWYAFGAIDEMRRDGESNMDMLDASHFALLYGATHKLPGAQPTIAWAWRAYRSFPRYDGTDVDRAIVAGLTPEQLSARAADIARG